MSRVQGHPVPQQERGALHLFVYDLRVSVANEFSWIRSLIHPSFLREGT